MKELKTNIVIGYKFTPKQLKELAVKNDNDLNGWYLYDYNTKYINVASDEFIKNSEDEIIETFIKVDTHETLHYAIYEYTNSISNKTEEKFVLIMAGQE